jgi:Phage tail lysozyme
MAMSTEGTFKSKSPVVIRWLIRDFHLKDFQAAGIVGNLGHESGGLTQFREIGASPGHGGYGWAQWTGPRAHAFLNWCHAHKLDWKSDAGNYGYLHQELAGPYAYVVAHLHECGSVDDATQIFERYYERAGVVALVDRIHWAKIALAAFRSNDEGA